MKDAIFIFVFSFVLGCCIGGLVLLRCAPECEHTAAPSAIELPAVSDLPEAARECQDHAQQLLGVTYWCEASGTPELCEFTCHPVQEPGPSDDGGIAL